MPVPLRDEEYRLFSEWLAEEFGLWFGPERREVLRVRLEPRRAELGLDSFEQLFFQLKFHPQRSAEREKLIPYLTNNESYFFRERAQLETFEREILPALAERLRSEGRRELRILSAGCSAGQEPYTLAMMLRNSEPRVSALRLRIHGVDLDCEALERARRGRFGPHSFRGVDDSVRARFFCEVGAREWEIVPELRREVEFSQANLADPDWARELAPQDVIFCRNVLIYFDRAGIQRAAQGLHNALAAGGYLFLGHAESLSRVATPLRAERRPGAVYYRRLSPTAGAVDP